MDEAAYDKAKKTLARSWIRRVESCDSTRMAIALSAPVPLGVAVFLLIGIHELSGALLLMLAGVLVFWLIMIPTFRRSVQTDKEKIAKLRQEVAAYDAAEERRAQRSGSRDRDDDGGGCQSKRQLQHEWYGDHSELNWRDRDLAESLGMDADSYVSNWLE